MSRRIITIDGPSGSGKGTIAGMLAERLGWRVLDSGALYRLVGLLVERSGIDFNSESQVADLARQMTVEFAGGKVLLDGEDVSLAIRSETAGNNASKVAALPAVRQALLDWQREQAGEPGLVADGRDMGTVVFPDAPVKIFLDASAEERAKRRYKQLMEKGLAANLATLTAEIRERDERDRNRAVAPLRPAEDAVVIDSTALGIEAVLDVVLAAAAKAFPGAVQ
jgi:cytidylate kinase